MTDFDRLFPDKGQKPLLPYRPKPRRIPRERTPRLPTRPPAVPLADYVEMPVPEASNRWHAMCVHGKCKWREIYPNHAARLKAAREHATEHGWRTR